MSYHGLSHSSQGQIVRTIGSADAAQFSGWVRPGMAASEFKLHHEKESETMTNITVTRRSCSQREAALWLVR